MTITHYFANPVGRVGSETKARVESLMRRGDLGYIDTPDQSDRHTRYEGLPYWCADNGCFSPKRDIEGIEWDEAGWWAWLSDMAQTREAGTCEFATAPDVVHMVPDGKGGLTPVGDAAATLVRSTPWLSRIRALGLPAAYVAQDGFDPTVVPWDEIDVLFIGGSDDFKVGPMGIANDGSPKGEVPCAVAIKEALARGKRVHMGRVNSMKRFRFASRMGCTSADGTWLTFGPDQNLPLLTRVIGEDRSAKGINTDLAFAVAHGDEYGWDYQGTVDVRGAVSHWWSKGDQTVTVKVSAGGRIFHTTWAQGDGDDVTRESAARDEAMALVLTKLR